MSAVDVKSKPLQFSKQDTKNWLGVDVPIPDHLRGLRMPDVPHHAKQVVIDGRGDGDEPHLTLIYGFDVGDFDAVMSIVEAEKLTEEDIAFGEPYVTWPTKARGAAEDGDMAVQCVDVVKTEKLENMLTRIHARVKRPRSDIPLHLTLNKWTGCAKARLLDRECYGLALYAFVGVVAIVMVFVYLARA